MYVDVFLFILYSYQYSELPFCFQTFVTFVKLRGHLRQFELA